MKLKTLGVLLGIILLVLILYFSGVQEVIQIILASNTFFIILAFLTFCLSVFLKSLRWKVFLKSLGLEVPYSHAFYSFNSALFLGNLVPFKAFEIARGYFLKVKFNCSFSKTIPLVITERAFDIFVYIIFSLVSLQALFFRLHSSIIFFVFLGMAIFFLISVVSLLVLNSKRMTLKIFKLLSILPLVKNHEKDIEKIAKNFSLGFNQLKKSRVLILILILTFIIWVVEGMIFLFSAKAVGINLPFSFFALPLLAILLGVLTFIPGGLGSIEAILVLLLTSLGFPLAQATSAVLIYRAMVHLLENSLGAIILPTVYGYDVVKKIVKGKV